MLKWLTKAVVEDLLRAAEHHSDAVLNVFKLAQSKYGDGAGGIVVTTEQLDEITDTPTWRRLEGLVRALPREARIELAALLKMGQDDELTWDVALVKAEKYGLADHITNLAGFGNFSRCLSAGALKAGVMAEA